LTIDPLWPFENAFSYARGMPTTLGDPFGTMTMVEVGFGIVIFGAAMIILMPPFTKFVRDGMANLRWPTIGGGGGTTFPSRPSMPSVPSAPAPHTVPCGPQVNPFPLTPPWLKLRPIPLPWAEPWPGPKGGTDCAGELLNCDAAKLRQSQYPIWDPVCERCATRCKTNGSWPLAEPCDYWTWGF
jgi:hypothetical protein